MNNKNVIKPEDIFLDIGRKLCSIIGWREAIGHVYALLYIKNQPMSLDNLAKRTNLSKSNVWGIIQQLLRLGAVNKVWLANSRKDYYAAERNFDLILSRGILPLLQSKVAFFNSCLEDAKLSLKNIKNSQMSLEKKYQHMLNEIVNQKEKMEALLGLLSGLDLS